MTTDFIVCRCEDVTLEAVEDCVNETGTLDLAEAKRRLRIGMGVCQGRICGPLLDRCFESQAYGYLDRSPVLRPVSLSDIAAHASDGASRIAGERSGDAQ